jgi:hypothetical protein
MFGMAFLHLVSVAHDLPRALGIAARQRCFGVVDEIVKATIVRTGFIPGTAAAIAKAVAFPQAHQFIVHALGNLDNIIHRFRASWQ